MLFVVDARVEAELVDHVVALLTPAGNADGAAAARLRQLPDHTTDCAARGTDTDRLPCLRLADADEAIPRRHAGHADGAEVGRQWDARGVHFSEQASRVAVDDAVLLPATHADDMIAFGEAGVTAVHHHTGSTANHHLVQLLRRRVALRVIHAPAHVRIERKIVV